MSTPSSHRITARREQTPVHSLPTLGELGRRIVVIGPSSAGKSTLAAMLAGKLGTRSVHLDQLFHTPGTEWVPRPDAEFDRLHAEAIAADGWVMAG